MQYVEVVANPPSRHHINRPLSVSSTRGRPQQDDQEGQEEQKEQEEQEEGHNSPPPVLSPKSATFSLFDNLCF